MTMPATLRPDDFEAMRHAMVASQLRTTAVDDPRVIAALTRVPREDFVPADRRAVAYADAVQPLGNGRYLNTPMASARLVNAAAIAAGERVLIVGAATGYVAALVALLGAQVVALEPDPALAAQGRAGTPQAEWVSGPLEAGAPDHAPYDAVVIDGAVEQVPAALVDQLAITGRMTCGIVDRGVTRLAVGRRGGSGFALRPFADAEIVGLPGFAIIREFAF